MFTAPLLSARAVNSPQRGLPKGMPAALKQQVGGMPIEWACLLPPWGGPERGLPLALGMPFG
ncbi:hypothetical protein JCM4914_74520 [Streptomyces platensis subsp. malvinus]